MLGQNLDSWFTLGNEVSAVTTNSIDFNNLNINSSYDFYVQAYCGNETLVLGLDHLHFRLYLTRDVTIIEMGIAMVMDGMEQV